MKYLPLLSVLFLTACGTSKVAVQPEAEQALPAQQLASAEEQQLIKSLMNQPQTKVIIDGESYEGDEAQAQLAAIDPSQYEVRVEAATATLTLTKK